MSGFTRLNIETKYVCHSPISPHANFHVNRMMGTVILLVKIAGGGGRKKRPKANCCYNPLGNVNSKVTYKNSQVGEAKRVDFSFHSYTAINLSIVVLKL